MITLAQRTAAAWRVAAERKGMAYWVASPGDPVHHIPTEEALHYRQHGGNTGDEDFPDLQGSIAKGGIKSPVEILTDGQRAFLSDGNNRAWAAYRLGLPHVPAHISHMSSEDYDFLADQSPIGSSGSHPRVGPTLKRIITTKPHHPATGIVGSLTPRRVAAVDQDYGLPPSMEFRKFDQPGMYGLQAAGIWHKNKPTKGNNWVSAITWKNGEIGNIETKERHKGNGYAGMLHQWVKDNHEPNLTHSRSLTPEGRAWAEKVGMAQRAVDAWRLAGKYGELPEGLTFSHGKDYMGRDIVDAHHEGKHVGQLTWRNEDGWGITPEGNDHPLDYITVHPEYRRRGVGTAMLNHIRDNIDPQISHSRNVTPSGMGFAKSDKFKPPPYASGDKGTFVKDPVRDDSMEWPDAAVGNGMKWDESFWRGKSKDRFAHDRR